MLHVDYNHGSYQFDPSKLDSLEKVFPSVYYPRREKGEAWVWGMHDGPWWWWDQNIFINSPWEWGVQMDGVRICVTVSGRKLPSLMANDASFRPVLLQEPIPAEP